MNPDPILRRLRDAERVWLRGVALERFLRLVKWGCALLLFSVALDLIAQLESAPRLTLTVLLTLGALGAAAAAFWRGWIHRGPLLRIARLLESRDPTLGSKLMNVLQLEEQAEDPEVPALTRRLARRAIDDASVELADHAFRPLVRSSTRARSVLHAAVPLVLMVGLVCAFSGIAWRQALRFLDPFGDHPPFSLTQLAIVTPARDGQGVLYRKPVTVEAEFRGHRPDELFLVVSGASEAGGETVVPMLPQGENRFVQQIEEVTTDLSVRAATAGRRSLSQARRIPVVLTPQLEGSRLRIDPPAYTKQKARESAIPLGQGASPALRALAGSALTFTLQSNRPLGVGAAAFQGSAAQAEKMTLQPGAGDADHTATVSFTATESGRLTFDLRDTGGLQTDSELAAALTVTHDLPPQIEIAEPAQDGFIVDTYEAGFAVRISDDLGILTTRLHSGVNGKWNQPKVVAAPDDPPQREGLETLRAHPVAMGAKPGDVLTFFGEVIDIRPEPQMARTRTLTLEVISEEDYNELLRIETEIGDLQEKYASLHDELDQLVHEQRKLAEAAQEAAEAAAQESQSDPAKQEKLAAQQDDLNQRLVKLAEKMETTVRDQPLYDLERSLQEVLTREAVEIRESVTQNEEDAGAGASPQQIAQAGHEQADRLDPASQEGREAIDQALADAQKMQDLMKPLMAWQALYEQQQDLASQTEALKQRRQLSHEDKLALQDMAARERAVGEGLEWIARELREKADAAEEIYPQAAEDAREIAEAIERAGLEGMADRASRSMLAARSAESHDRAEALRAAMEKLMPQCKSCQPGMGGEFAQRLSLARSMLAGNTFEQMAMSRKFGLGRGPPGMGIGMGSGGDGGWMAWGNTANRPQTSLLGSETRLGRRDGPESVTASKGQAQGAAAPGAALADDEGSPAAPGVTTSSRPSTTAATDAAAEQYRELVDAYFRKLTTGSP